jgi:ABC-type uncharacterized transport system substrate-binding protein
VKQFWILDFGFSIGESKSKKVFCLVLCAVLLALSFPADAQQAKKVPRIGFVSASGNPKTPGPSVEAFRQGLRDLGYVEGKNILVELRSAEGNPDRFPRLVAELVQLKIDVLVSGTLPAIQAAKEATKTIPIVVVSLADPVATGLIGSLARPGGNITGARDTRPRVKRKTAGITYGGGSGDFARRSRLGYERTRAGYCL